MWLLLEKASKAHKDSQVPKIPALLVTVRSGRARADALKMEMYGVLVVGGYDIFKLEPWSSSTFEN